MGLSLKNHSYSIVYSKSSGVLSRLLASFVRYAFLNSKGPCTTVHDEIRTEFIQVVMAFSC